MSKGNTELRSLLGPDTVRVKQSFPNKAALLTQISELAAPLCRDAGVSKETICSALTAREEVGSTGFGDGIAIPHCRLEGLRHFVVGLITLDGDGVPFDSLDGKPVKLAVFIIAPSSSNDSHVSLLSAISQALLIPGAVDEICAAATVEDACSAMRAHVREDLTEEEQSKKQLFHVFVQDEEVLYRLLEVFTALDAHSVAVLDGRQAHSYLAKAPLFAGLWSDQNSDFCQVILATLNKKLSNEAIRRIEHITGPLAKCRNVLLTVQDVAYSAGSLSL